MADESAQIASKPLHKTLRIYHKFGNFRENFFFANSVKRNICDFKNSRLGHDLPNISKLQSDLAISRGI